MKCPACNSSGPFEDGFCTTCGLEQPLSRLPVKRDSDPFPAIWREAAPVVARGLALVLAGVAAEWLLRNTARKATGVSLPTQPTTRARTVAGSEPQLMEEIIAVSHTVVRRRLLIKR